VTSAHVISGKATVHFQLPEMTSHHACHPLRYIKHANYDDSPIYFRQINLSYQYAGKDMTESIVNRVNCTLYYEFLFFFVCFFMDTNHELTNLRFLFLIAILFV